MKIMTPFNWIMLWIVIGLAGFAGWVENIIWTFHQTMGADLVLGIIGIFVGPIGAIHGLYLLL